MDTRERLIQLRGQLIAGRIDTARMTIAAWLDDLTAESAAAAPPWESVTMESTGELVRIGDKTYGALPDGAALALPLLRAVEKVRQAGERRAQLRRGLDQIRLVMGDQQREVHAAERDYDNARVALEDLALRAPRFEYREQNDARRRMVGNPLTIAEMDAASAFAAKHGHAVTP